MYNDHLPRGQYDWQTDTAENKIYATSLAGSKVAPQGCGKKFTFLDPLSQPLNPQLQILCSECDTKYFIR